MTVELTLDLTNSAQISANSGISASVTGLTVKYRRKNDNNDDWQFIFSSDTGPITTNYDLVANRHAKAMLRSFLTEANVSFRAPQISAVTGQTVDEPSQLSLRSGQDLAQLITQLLIDIRAADAEDTQRWVEQNPDKVMPAELVGKRMSRFTDAFHYMFERKRFRNIQRLGGALEVLFEEDGRVTTINQLSTGEKQIVFRGGFVLKNLAHVQSGLLLIDEPELSLHPEWQSRILGFYRRLVPITGASETQIIVATHSPFIVHGMPRAKVIILEKDGDGKIRVAPQPTYPSPGANQALAAFNIDGFISTAKYNLLVLVEGESDVLILSTAWDKLYPKEPRFFELRSALGAKNIGITLNDSELFSKVTLQKIVGLLDYDDAYNQWNGIWKKDGKLVVVDDSSGLTRKHPKGPAWSMLLPVPPHRKGFASSVLKGASILSIELLFPESDIPPEFMEEKAGPLGAKIPMFRQSKKTKFSQLVNGLSPQSFEAFRPLFDRWRQIAQGQLD